MSKRSLDMLEADRAYRARRRVATGTARPGDRKLIASYQARRRTYRHAGRPADYAIAAVVTAVRVRLGIDLSARTRPGSDPAQVERARSVAVIVMRDAGHPLRAIGTYFGRRVDGVCRIEKRGRTKPGYLRLAAEVRREIDRRAGTRHPRQEEIVELLGPFRGQVITDLRFYELQRAIAGLVIAAVPAPADAGASAGERYVIHGVVGDDVWRMLDRWAEMQEFGYVRAQIRSRPPSLRRVG